MNENKNNLEFNDSDLDDLTNTFQDTNVYSVKEKKKLSAPLSIPTVPIKQNISTEANESFQNDRPNNNVVSLDLPDLQIQHDTSINTIDSNYNKESTLTKNETAKLNQNTKFQTYNSETQPNIRMHKTLDIKTAASNLILIKNFYQEKTKELNSKLEELQKKYTQIKISYENVLSDKYNSNLKFKNISAKVYEVQLIIPIIKKQEEEINRAIAKVEKTMNVLENFKNIIETRYDSLKVKQNKIDTTLISLEVLKNENNKKLVSLKQENEDLKNLRNSIIEENSKNIKILNNKIDELEKKITFLTELKEKYQKENEELKKVIQNNEKQKDNEENFKQKYLDLFKLFEENQKQLNLNTTINETKTIEYNKNIETLNNKISDMEKELYNLNKLQINNNLLTKEIEKQKEENIKLKKEKEEISKNLEKISTEMERSSTLYISTKNFMEDKINKQNTTITELNEEIVKLKTNLKATYDNLDKTNSDINIYKKKEQEQIECINSLREANKIDNEKIESLVNKIILIEEDNYSEKIRKHQKEETITEQTVLDYKKNLLKFENMITKLQAKIKNLESINKVLTSEKKLIQNEQLKKLSYNKFHNSSSIELKQNPLIKPQIQALGITNTAEIVNDLNSFETSMQTIDNDNINEKAKSPKFFTDKTPEINKELTQSGISVQSSTSTQRSKLKSLESLLNKPNS